MCVFESSCRSTLDGVFSLLSSFLFFFLCFFPRFCSAGKAAAASKHGTEWNVNTLEMTCSKQQQQAGYAVCCGGGSGGGGGR